MTVGYYRLPSWAYGLEHQNTAPFGECDSNVHDQLPPPFGERFEIFNSVCVSNLI